MKKAFYLLFSICLTLNFTTSIYSEQNTFNESIAINSNNPLHYEETDSVVFADNKAYFKFNDPDVATTIIKNRWSKNIDYTFTEKSTMYSYTYNQSSIINGSLEHVKGNVNLLPEHIKEDVLSLDLSINKLQIPWNIITYRYVYEDFLLYSLVSKEQLNQFYKNKRFDSQILDVISYGTKVNKYGFMSTTILKNGAMSHRPIELKIRLSRGNLGAYLAPYSAYPYEQELLLPRNSQLIVDGAHLENNNQRLVLDALYVT